MKRFLAALYTLANPKPVMRYEDRNDDVAADNAEVVRNLAVASVAEFRMLWSGSEVLLPKATLSVVIGETSKTPAVWMYIYYFWEAVNMTSRVFESEKRRILLYRKNNRTASYKDIADEFDRSPSTVGRIIREAKRAGMKGL